MARENSMKPNYQILAYLTLNKDRVLSSSCLVLTAANEKELKTATVDIAKALKADVTKLTNGDYMVIQI